LQAPHAVQVEVISAERVEVLAHQRRCQAENVVIAVLALSTQLINERETQSFGLFRIVEWIAEFPFLGDRKQSDYAGLWRLLTNDRGTFTKSSICVNRPGRGGEKRKEGHEGVRRKKAE